MKNELEVDFENLIRKYMRVMCAGDIYNTVLEVIFSISLSAAQRHGQEKNFKEECLKDVEKIISKQMISLSNIESKKNDLDKPH